MSDWKEFHEKQVAGSTMQAKQISLNTARVWAMREDGDFGRPDHGFFDVVGVTTYLGNPEQREVPNWDQPMFKELTGEGDVAGYVGLLQDETSRILMQFKIEPGNASDGLLAGAASVSFSESNRQKKHGGKAPPFAEIVDVEGNKWYRILQDGGRNFRKVNKYTVVKVKGAEITLPANCIWVNKKDLREMLEEGLLGDHLMQCLGVLYLTT